VPKNTFTIHPAFAQAKVFADLTEDELAEVAGRFSKRSFSRGENFFIEGTPARVFYLIAEGEVKVLQTSALSERSRQSVREPTPQLPKP
jgi:CRP-like cAMP-binding protein